MISRRIGAYIIGIAAAAGIIGFYFANATAAETEVGVEKVIDYYAEAAQQDVTVKKGEIQTIQVNVIAPEDKEYNLKLYVSEPSDLFGTYREAVDEKLTEGMTVQVDKKEFDLNAISKASDQAKRDSFTMSIIAGPTTLSGTHTFALTLDDGKSFSTTYARINVVD